MYENILAAVIGLDEPESLGGIEPLHDACSHVRTPHLSKQKQIKADVVRRKFDSDQSNCGGTKVFLIDGREREIDLSGPSAHPVGLKTVGGSTPVDAQGREQMDLLLSLKLPHWLIIA